MKVCANSMKSVLNKRMVRVKRKGIAEEVMKKDRQLVEPARLEISPEQGIFISSSANITKQTTVNGQWQQEIFWTKNHE